MRGDVGWGRMVNFFGGDVGWGSGSSLKVMWGGEKLLNIGGIMITVKHVIFGLYYHLNSFSNIN